MSKPKIKRCRRCRTAKVPAGFICRKCGALCCEHLCGYKARVGVWDIIKELGAIAATCGACAKGK